MPGYSEKNDSQAAAVASEDGGRSTISIDVLSLFPAYFEGPLQQSLLKRAQDRGLLTFHLVDIRNFAVDKHRKVDDRPFGGGPGMVMKPGPICEAVRSRRRQGSHVVYLTPQGKLLTAKRCRQLAGYSHLILLCGHYEGVDERAIKKEVDEEISIGDYVLMSGGPAALVLIEGISRFIPGVLGNEQSFERDSFEVRSFKGPQYTTPLVYEGERVPDELRSGNHALIEKWRMEQAEKKFKKNRSDVEDNL